MTCEFIPQLSKLRKLSEESVENTESFDAYNRYMHVERPLEEELRTILRLVKSSDKKALVLLCGSAGDGKSHLISYLKNSDEEKLLEDFATYNDATESDEPTKTSVETLAKKLVAFNDENYCNEGTEKLILAINIGTLNNFIQSEEGDNYSALRHYVNEQQIVSGLNKVTRYIPDSAFQHVSFSDYQLFGISENGIKDSFLVSLLEKIFAQENENPFYTAYKKCENCTFMKRCPVRDNYQLMFDPMVRSEIIRRIVDVVLINKTIVTPRDVLNLIYDLIVHPEFNTSKLSKQDVEFIDAYLSWTTPMLLAEYADISNLLNMVGSTDSLNFRNETLDSNAVSFHSLENIEAEFDNATKGTPYNFLKDLTNISLLGGTKPELKKLIFKFITRLQGLTSHIVSDEETSIQTFIQYLYYQASGQERKLNKIYEMTKKAVVSWDGEFGSDQICIDNSNDAFWVVEHIEINPKINSHVDNPCYEIQRFEPTLRLRFKYNDYVQESLSLDIDYSLFRLIQNMSSGYSPSSQDSNYFANFVSFIQSVKDRGNKIRKVIIIPKGRKKYKAIFEQNDFGYEFKVENNGL